MSEFNKWANEDEHWFYNASGEKEGKTAQEG